MRVMRDVIVQSDANGLIAIGQAPGTVGEVLTLDLAGAGHLVTCRVRVRESRPVILNGRVRHRVCLEVLDRSQRVETGELPATVRA